ncbi:MAG: uroporphyrinogen decarboxylase family protein [Rikenellaceae bacterium]
MTHKERFLATIERREVDYPASWMGMIAPESYDALYSYFNVSSLDGLREALGDDVYGVDVAYNNPPTNDIGCALNFAKELDDLTQGERTLSAPGFFENIRDISQIESFNWPNPADHIDVEECRRRAKSAPSDYFRMGIIWSAHFQDVCAAFGMSEAFIAMFTDPEFFQAVVDRILKFHLEAGEIFYEATKGEIDGILIGNDFGTQTSMFMSPEELRKFIFPGTKMLVDQAKSYGLKVIHHACGSIYPVIDDLFDMGIDSIHPIQALATDMSAEKLSADFKRGSFFGGVDQQQLLVNGTPEEVAADIKRLKSLFPTGLVISPSHGTITNDIPPANMEALFSAIKEK